MLEFEFEKPSSFTCECCGGATSKLTRFVYQNGDAFAIYYALFSERHRNDGIAGIIGLGDWSEEADPNSRVAFAFRLWKGEDNFNVTIIDATASEWSSVNILGQKLTREEALQHPWIENVYHITDHMTIEDPEIREFFSPEAIH